VTDQLRLGLQRLPGPEEAARGASMWRKHAQTYTAICNAIELAAEV